MPAVDVAECPACVDHAARSPHLVGACASVGIEHGKTTRQMLHEYLRGVHHREAHDPA